MHVAVTYGLGKLEISDQLALSAGSGPALHATSSSPRTCTMPPRGRGSIWSCRKGMRVDPSTPVEQTIEEASRRTQIFWKVRPGSEGRYPIGATSENNRAKPINVAVQARSIFG